MNYAGVTGATVDALLSQSATSGALVSPLRGLVVAGTGNGSIHQDLEAALRRAQAQGIRVVRASRCASGRVLSPPGNGLPQSFPDSQGLSAVKARVALMLALLA
jgi:L-asparaginase